VARRGRFATFLWGERAGGVRIWRSRHAPHVKKVLLRSWISRRMSRPTPDGWRGESGYANRVAFPTAGSQRRYGLLRSAVKHCVWLGNPGCYRNQDAVLLPPSESLRNDSRITKDKVVVTPSGHSMNQGRCIRAAIARGGVSPKNLLDFVNTTNPHQHSASTPLPLCDWWIRYLTQTGDTVLDPFMGSGTTGAAARMPGRRFIGIEKDERYFALVVRRLRKVAEQGTAAVG